MDILILPSDILVYQLTILPIDSLFNICQANSQFNQLIKNDYFWQIKSKLDYNTLIDKKTLNETWKSFYGDMLKNRLVSITYKSHFQPQKDIILIGPRFTLKEIINNIIKKINIEPLNVTIIFSSDNKILLAVTTYDEQGIYFERIYDTRWILETNQIKIHKHSTSKLMLNECPTFTGLLLSII